MNKILLFLTLVISTLAANAQFLQTYDFDGGLPNGWVPEEIPVGPYSYDDNGDCVTDEGILLTGPVAAGSINLMTGILSTVNNGYIVQVSFDSYVLNTAVDCNQALLPFPCATNTAKLYVVSTDFQGEGATPTASQIYAESTEIAITANGQTRLFAPITATLPAASDFRIYVVATFGGTCQGTGNRTVVIDNVTIEASEETATPVTFKAFTASRKSGTVLLSWTTASEQNNRGFSVQRNLGAGWKDVAFISSAADGGNSSTDLTYTFTDANAEQGLSQYRIQQTDYDGRYSFSDVRVVRGAGAARVIVYPNPSPNGKASLMFDEDNIVRDIFVSDGQGRIVKQYRQTTDNNLVIDQLSKGFYTIRIVNRNTGAAIVEKLVVN